MASPWRVSEALTGDERLHVLGLLDYLETNLGREAIDESRRRAVVHGVPTEHWLNYVNGHLVNYAAVTVAPQPSLEMAGGGFDRDLLEGVLERHPCVDWWTRGPHRREGGRDVRTLLFLRVALPVPVEEVPEGARLRHFDIERDEAAWLAQNNAAFADHPEQGAWRRDDLDARAHEPWFDPSGFLVLEIDGHLVASCWTKIHELYQERFGEIYVVSVDPRFQGRGLGRVMLTQGLDALSQRGVTVAGIFVDASNVGATALYRSLGFELVREDHLTRFERALTS